MYRSRTCAGPSVWPQCEPLVALALEPALSVYAEAVGARSAQALVKVEACATAGGRELVAGIADALKTT
jgi:hypothetical protein